MRYLLLFLFSLFFLGIEGVHCQTYRGAELRTHESYQYGRFEARIKSAQGEGLLASFFTYNDSTPATPWAEIDIEILGRWSDNIDMNVIDENGSHLRQHPTDFNPHTEFHDYAIEWTPDYVAWFIDGREVYRQTGAHIAGLTESGKLMMNTWTPVYEDWVGIIDDRALPKFSYYDWVSYAEYTPGSGSTGSDLNFSPVWKDDFDAYDPDRWGMGTHTWNGNNALLVPENIVYKDGFMILCLTLPDKQGFLDDQPPHILWARAFRGDSVVVRFSEVVDSITASSATTYNIPGSSIESANLHPDQCTVSLHVDQIDLSGSASVFALGLKDQAAPANTQMGSYASISMPKPINLPINIDCAGGGAQGFLPDQRWSSTVEYGHEGGNYQTAADYPDLTGTDLDSVMATSLNRFSRYHVRLSPGIFDIKLHFAEHFYDKAGDRVFQLYMEDSLIINELDVYKEVGNTGVYTVSVLGLEINDGSLDILASALIYGRTYVYAGPFLNAIEINGDFWVGVESVVIPCKYSLDRSFPNPFNAQTQFSFSLPESAWVDISLFDLRGSELKNLISGDYAAGRYRFTLQGDKLSSGVYVVKMQTSKFIKSRKILLLK